jgi:hypothetical protein
MKIATFCRWTGRLTATAVTALFITFLVGEGTPDLRELTDYELLGFGAVLLMVLGTLAGWVRDLHGALLILAGYAAFAAIENGWPPLPFAAYLAAGILLLISRALRLFHRGGKTAPPATEPAPLPPAA